MFWLAAVAIALPALGFALSATSICHDTRLAILHWRAIRAELNHIDGQCPQVPVWILKESE